jgi:hypothetical protein
MIPEIDLSGWGLFDYQGAESPKPIFDNGIEPGTGQTLTTAYPTTYPSPPLLGAPPSALVLVPLFLASDQTPEGRWYPPCCKMPVPSIFYHFP